MKHLFHVDELVHDPRLADISRNAVEHQDIDIGLKRVRVHGRIDLRFPELDGNFVRHQLAFARVVEKSGAHLRPRVDRSKYISTGAMKKARDTAEGASLGSLAAAGRAKKKIGLVFHGWTDLGL